MAKEEKDKKQKSVMTNIYDWSKKYWWVYIIVVVLCVFIYFYFFSTVNYGGKQLYRYQYTNLKNLCASKNLKVNPNWTKTSGLNACI